LARFSSVWIAKWVKLILHGCLLNYLGLPSESVVIKIAQLMWWIAGAVFGFVYALYRPELEAVIKNWLGKVSQ
jgi:uncharacterized membrane protein